MNHLGNRNKDVSYIGGKYMFKIIDEKTEEVLYMNEDGNVCIEWFRNYAKDTDAIWKNTWLSLDNPEELQLIEKHLLWMYLEGKVRSKHNVSDEFALNKTNVTSALAQKNNQIVYELMNYRNYKLLKGVTPLYLTQQ